MIETCVRTRQHITIFSVSSNVELDRSKPKNRCTITSRSEGKEFALLIVTEFLVDDFPQPFTLRRLVTVPLNKSAILLPGKKIEDS